MKYLQIYIILFLPITPIVGQIDIEDYLLDSITYLNISQGEISPIYTEKYQYDSQNALSESNCNDNTVVRYSSAVRQKIQSSFYLDKTGKDSLEFRREVQRFDGFGSKVLKRKYYSDSNQELKLYSVDSSNYNQHQLLSEEYYRSDNGNSVSKRYWRHSYDQLNRKVLSEFYESDSDLEAFELRRRIENIFYENELRFSVNSYFGSASLSVDSTKYLSTNNEHEIHEVIEYNDGEKVEYNWYDDYKIDDIQYSVRIVSDIPFTDTLTVFTKTQESESTFFDFDIKETFRIFNDDTTKTKQETNDILILESGTVQTVNRTIITNPNFGSSIKVVTSFYKQKRDHEITSEINEFPTISFYPNPVRKGTFLFLAKRTGEETTAIIYNYIGQKVSSVPIQNQLFLELDSGLIQGAYYLFLQKNNERISQATPFIIVN